MKVRLYLLFWTLVLATTLTHAQHHRSLYVGTYTNEDSEGIYSYTFDDDRGILTNRTLVAASVNPSFLTISKKRSLVLAVNETADFDIRSGALSSFNLNTSFETGENGLTLNNQVASNGGHPCHIALDQAENIVAVSNYSGGTVSLHKINRDGSLAKGFQVIDHNKLNSEKQSHTHAAKFYKNSLFVADLGLDSFFHYIKKGDQYELRNRYFLGENAGPRHFEISKRGRFIYVINELNSTISVLQKSGMDYVPVQQVSTLSDTFKGKSYCADIHLSKDERFLYGTNRGENSIVVFERDSRTGLLTTIQNISTEGDWPRNFTLSPSGKFLLVANQRSNDISVFRVNRQTGKLEYSYTEGTPSPVCLQFFPI